MSAFVSGAPGEVIECRVPDRAAGQGLQVRIGCHTDGLWHLDAWRRCPEITRGFPLGTAVTRAANAFGGPVYLEVPADCGLGPVEVEIQGAVEAPRFVLGTTDPVQWREQLRDQLAPWAELECSRVILTVPSASRRGRFTAISAPSR